MVFRGFVLTLFFALWSVIPTTTSAAGLVPCGGPGEEPCQMCHVAQLVNGGVDWLVGILSLLFALMIAISGVQMVVLTGSATAKEKAKNMVTNGVIGFSIVLAAWLLIDYGMKMVLNDGESGFGPWNELTCVAQPSVIAGSVNYVDLSDGGGTWSEACEELPNGQYNCSNLENDCRSRGGTPTVTTSRPPTVECNFNPGDYGGTCELLTSGPCSPENLTSYFGSRAEEASRICNMESGGRPILSGADLCCGPNAQCSGAPSFSGGYFQVNILAHADKIPGCNLSSFLNVGSSVRGMGSCVRRNSEGICTGWSCTIQRGAAYDTCIRATQDPATNLTLAGRIFREAGNSFRPWRNSARRCSIPE